MKRIGVLYSALWVFVLGAADLSELPRTPLLTVSEPVTLSQDFTVGPDRTLRIEPGGVIEIAADAALTVNGRLEAGAYPIFAGPGRVNGSAKIDAVLPEWFFAGTDDADADWTPAINRAVAWANANCRIVRLQSRRYRITGTIDLTSTPQDNRAGMRLEGALRSTQYQRGTALIGDTGASPMLATTDSDGIHLKDLALIAGSRTPSVIGILQARGTGTGWGGDQYYENLYLNLGSDPAANDGIGTIGLINLAAEESRYHNLQIWANLPLVFTWTDTIMVTNPQLDGSQRSFHFPAACDRPPAVNASNTVFALSGLNRLIALDYVSPCVLLNCVATLDLGDTFLQMRPSGQPGVTPGNYHYALENWNCFQLKFFGAIEGAGALLLNRRALADAELNVRLAETSPGNALPLIQFYDDGGHYPWSRVSLRYHSYDTERPLLDIKSFNGTGGFSFEACEFQGNLPTPELPER